MNQGTRREQPKYLITNCNTGLDRPGETHTAGKDTQLCQGAAQAPGISPDRKGLDVEPSTELDLVL